VNSKEVFKITKINLSYKEEKNLLELRHNNKLVELEHVRETEKIKHSMRLEINRIQNAELRKRETRRSR
jgi:hypothetical protein